MLVSPSDEKIGFHTQYAVPGADSDYAQTLKDHLSELGGVKWTTDTSQSPWTLYAEDIPSAKSKAIVEVFLRVADHIAAAEDGARARVLVQEFGSGAKPTPKTSSSPFENIGDAAPSKSEAPEEPTSATDDSAQDNPGLKAFRVAVRDGVIHADIDLAAAPTSSAKTSLLDAFSQALPVRFDVTLLSADFADSETLKHKSPASIQLAMRANIAAQTGEIAGELGRYLERAKKFNDFGLPLLEVLGGRQKPSRTPKAERAPKRRAAAPRARKDTASAPSTSSENVVFSFGGGALDVQDITSDALRPGDYRDPRIRRDDATTPLVDVVLRHPGFSDKSMRQVLSILLDVTYYDATKLTESAPCLIAWGVSQERAAEFKSVIENAGGRVTLVEPDSLS